MTYLKYYNQVNEEFSPSLFTDQVHSEDRELSAFVAEVASLLGPEQAKLSEEVWLEESDLIDSPPRSEVRNWRAVTIAASARLANRVNVRSPVVRRSAIND